MSFLHYLLALLFGFSGASSDKYSSEKSPLRPATQVSTTSNTSNNQRKTGGPDRIGGHNHGPIIIIEDTHYKAND